MKQFSQLAVAVILAAATSCGQSAATPSHGNGTMLDLTYGDARPQTVHVVPFFDFGKSGYDGVGGSGGRGGLIGTETELYGSTTLGGDSSCSTDFDTGSNTGCGIVYRLVPNNDKRKYKLETLHVFAGAPSDGAVSLATLFEDKHGNLYGTTFFGGTYNAGTLFKLQPTSSGYTETIVHSFGYGTDGANPSSGVIEVKGTLYGTTQGGGVYSNQTLCGHYGAIPSGTCGTVYRVNPDTGTERVLHSFGKPMSGDGANPAAALLDVGNTLYGTTDLGGSLDLCGTVFKIRLDGKGERVMHSFLNAGHGDGCNPFASLIEVNDTMYGTTCCGGGNFCSNHCEGTLFSIDPSTGKEQVLHEFGKTGDGSEPEAGLVNVQGVLYGTTGIGGSPTCGNDYGCGTIFSYTPSTSSPTYTVLYQFDAGNDGADPTDALLYSRHKFYGTTNSAGKKGLGTAFKLRP